MKITAQLALSQMKVNKKRTIAGIFAIALATSLITTVMCFVTSANKMLTDFLGSDYGEYGVSLIFAVPGRIQDIHQTDRHAVYRSQNRVDLRRFLLRLQHHSFLRKQRSRQQKEDRNAPAEFHFIIPSACCAATRREERRVPRQHSCCPDSPFRARRYRRQFHDRDSCGSPASRESNSRRNQTPAF